MRNLILYAILLLIWLIAGKETTTVMAAIPEVKQQQGRYISGRITDAEDGETIPGASVFFTNTTIGTTTDVEGNYRLRIPGEGSYRLTVSHVGYQSVVEDIEPGKTSVVFNASLQTQELEEVKVSAGIRFRQRDITLFWSNILGKNPSRRTIQATNPETVYYYYNPETKILKVLCREPLEIINYETGYRIQYLLDYFTHDYNSNITNWEYQSIFSELEPDNDRQQNAWEKKRKEIYQVSIAKFIKSLYHNTLLPDGFVLTPLRISGQSDPAPGRADPFRQSSIINPNDILSTNPADNSKLLDLNNAQMMLISYGRPVNDYDIANISHSQSGPRSLQGAKWEQENRDVFRNQLHGGRIRIYPDGTYTNRLFLSPMDVNNPLLLGLSMTLPIDYNPETTMPLVTENTNILLPDEYAETIQNSSYSLENAEENITAQLIAYPQEKIHLHTDRDFYVPGEKVWFKAYLADAQSHLNATNSYYVYVELISPADTLVNRVMITQINGMFFGYLPISNNIPEGDYTLRAYTRYMENLGDDYFFKKNIRIAGKNNYESKIGLSQLRITNYESKKDLSQLQNTNYENNKEGGGDFDVSFFPEGGNLVEGVLSKVAFKALNSSGLPATVSGKLINENGAEITTVETQHAGMGMFVYTPVSGEKIYLLCRNENGIEKRFKLPQPTSQAYTITASPRSNNLFVEIQRSANTPYSPLYLLAHCRGMLLHFSEWDKEKKAAVFALDKFPAGVVQFVLFDSQMNPLSERLVFNKNDDASAAIELQTDKDTYQIRDKVIATLSPSSTLPKWEWFEGNFSVSVTDDKDIAVDESTTILSSLLLSSELKGFIENPAYYLQDNPASNAALDLLMMTHGWRRYNIPDVVQGRLEHSKIPFQEFQKISGQVKSLILSRPVEDSEILVMMRDGGVGVTSTDKNGSFFVQDLLFPDSTTIYIRAVNKDGRDNVKLVVDQESFPKLVYAPQSVFSRQLRQDTETKDASDFNVFIAKAEQRAKYEEDIWTIQLKELEVSAPRIKRNEARLQFWANTSSNQTITRNEIEKIRFSYVADYLSTFAGIHVSPEGEITIFGVGTTGSPRPLILIDGIVQDWPDKALERKTESPLERVSVNMIESIDIFKGPSGIVFGMRGANGAISITTRRGANSPFTEKDNHFIYTPLGYQKPVEFYAPKYETLASRQSPIPDYRTTIFWKPDVVLSDDGEASFEFFTSDFRTTYSVVIEGLTTDGRIVRQVGKITVSD